MDSWGRCFGLVGIFLAHCCPWPFQVYDEHYLMRGNIQVFFPDMKKKDFVSKLENRIQHLIRLTGSHENLKNEQVVPTVRTRNGLNTPPSCTGLGLPEDEFLEELPLAEDPEGPGSLKKKT